MIDYILQVPWYGLIWITITLLYIISGWIELFNKEDKTENFEYSSHKEDSLRYFIMTKNKKEINKEKINSLNDLDLYLYRKIFHSNIFDKKTKGERK